MRWRDVVERFWHEKPAKGGGLCTYHGYTHYRDVVFVEDDKIIYEFHEYPIAIWYKYSNILELNDYGFTTNTTACRLNAITPLGSVSTINSYHMVLEYDKFLYALPVRIDLNTKKIFSYNEKYVMVPRLGRKTVERFTDYVVLNTRRGIVWINEYRRVNMNRVVVFKDGSTYAPMLNGSDRYVRHYGNYVCAPVGL